MKLLEGGLPAAALKGAKGSCPLPRDGVHWSPVDCSLQGPLAGHRGAVTSAEPLSVAEQTGVPKTQGPQMAPFYVLTCLCSIVFFPLWSSCVVNKMR